MRTPTGRDSTRIICALVLTLALYACGKPQPPDRERPPEPQAAEHTQLRDAIQQPIDRAKQADEAVQKAAEEQRKAIEAAGG